MLDVSNPGRGARFPVFAGPIMLLLGFALGAMAHSTGSSFLNGATGYMDVLGTLWLNALKVSVVPLTVSLLVVGIATLPSGKDLGKWGGAIVLTFLSLLVLGVAFSLLLGMIFVRVFPPHNLDLVEKATAAGKDAGGFADWLTSLIPPNLFEAVVKGDLLPIAILSSMFALAVRRLQSEHRNLLVSIFTACRDALLIYVRWVMVLLPIGGFALAYSLIAETGVEFATTIVQFIIYASFALILFGFFIYLLVGLVARVKLNRFAKAAAPSQIMAVGSRSSLACLPAMVESVETMGLPEAAGELSLPMAVAIFKLNRSITAPSKLIFFGTVFGISLDAPTVLTFVVTTLLISLSTPGLPSGAGASNFGAYVAAGLPPQGVALFETINPILDPLNTALNVTGNLAAAAIASRFADTEAV